MPRRALPRAACGFHRVLRSWIISIFIRVFCVYYHALFGGNRFRAFETGCRFARERGFRRAGRFGLSAAFCAGRIDRRLDRGGVSACFSRGAGRIVYGGIFLSCARRADRVRFFRTVRRVSGRGRHVAHGGIGNYGTNRENRARPFVLRGFERKSCESGYVFMPCRYSFRAD